MNNKQVLPAVLTSAMILISAGTVSAGTYGTGEEGWYTTLVTAQTPSLLMFDSLLYNKPLSPTSSTAVTLTAVADATVKSWQPDSNFGSENVLTPSYSTIDEVAEEPGYVKNFNVVSYPDVQPGTYGGIAFRDPLLAEKPDLIITDVWNEDGRLGYQIRNIGNGTAPQGHHTLLSVAGKKKAEDFITVYIRPGERLKRCFDYGWLCTPPEDVIAVCADCKDVVGEGDETNNCRKEVWKCDNTPPNIVSGPTMSEITTTSAAISWVTDEDSDSVVKYGKYAGKYSHKKKEPELVKKHSIDLNRLKASTTYQYMVQSTDYSGNRVSSKVYAFETDAPPDDENPSIFIADPGVCKGTVTISAAVSDNIRVGKVEFYINGKYLSSDYSPPYQLLLDTTKYKNGTYAIKAKVRDIAGRSSESECAVTISNLIADRLPPTVRIISPGDGDTIGQGTIEITVEAYDQGPKMPPVDRVEFYINDNYKCSDSVTDLFPFIYNYSWKNFFVSGGEYEIKAIAYDDAGNSAVDTVTVTVPEPTPTPIILRPQIEVTRLELSHTGTCYHTGLRVENVGNMAASEIEVVDRLVGFQVRYSQDWHLRSRFDASTKECEVTLGSHLALDPGSYVEMRYHFVPILTEDDISYQVGSSTSLSYEGPFDQLYTEELSIPEPGGVAVDDAFEEAKYLIVTHPERLFTHYNDDDVDNLMVSMAKLAAQKHGVLGYLNSYSASTLKCLIRSEGDWGSRLFDNWGSAGRLLIVGETEIVPSYLIIDAGIQEAVTDAGWDSSTLEEIPMVDNQYADISGDDNKPELVVGRLIGDNADRLRTPIETSLLREFDCSHALVVCGTDPDRVENRFTDRANEVADLLDDGCSVCTLYWDDYAGESNMRKEFTFRIPDMDIVFFIDHGNPTRWKPALDTSHFPLDFKSSYPVVFGCACSTGAYEGGYSIGEAFLDSKAGVYIGATETAEMSIGTECTKEYFNKWVGGQQSTGMALKHTKRRIVSEDPGCPWKRLWVLEYNLYGDPMYAVCGGGVSVSDVSSSVEMTTTEPLSSLEVVVPDYEVTSRRGMDYVKIPGGTLLLVQDKPIVPFYLLSLNYTRGYEIQDVILTDRSGLTTTTSLNLSLMSIFTDNDSGEGAEATSLRASGWYPEVEYSWSTFENPDGSITLVIRLYPFYYNPLTTDVKFYKNYSFDINYTSSDIEITNLTTDRVIYQRGTKATVDLGLNNTGEAQDVIVSALIKRYSSGEIVDGLILRTLKEFEGIASVSPQWNSSGFEPGYYFVEVTLKDTSGDVLDRKTEMFRLGISSGEIVSFTATPECFNIGDGVEIEMAFENTGTVNITGTAVIRVLNSTGDATEEFRHNVTSLTPSGSVIFSDAWDTSGAEAGSSYTIIGYVLYDSKSTDPATVTVWNMIMGDLNRDGEITAADAAIALRFAATGGRDPAADVDCDGEVTALDALMILQAATGNIEL